MSIRIMSQVFEKSKTKLAARLVLLALADNASDEGYCYPSIATIARKAGVSEATTGEYMQAFVKIGLVTKAERYNSEGKQTSNGYTINIGMIGNDEITQEIMADCRPPSKVARVGISVLPPINKGGKGVTPTGGKGVTPESSLEPKKLEEEEEEAKPTLKSYVDFYQTNVGYPGSRDSIIYQGICEWAGKVSLAYWQECVTRYVKTNGHTFTYLEQILTNGPRSVGQKPTTQPTTARPEYRGKRVSTPAPATDYAAERERKRRESEAFWANATPAGD